MRHGVAAFAAASALALTVFAFGQVGQPGQAGQGNPGGRGGGPRGPVAPAAPTPHFPSGRVDLGATSGQTGLWLPANGGNERLIDDNSAAAPRGGAAAAFPGKLKENQVPYQPWARALNAYRMEDRLEPHTRCKPSGGPRQFLTPYGVEFVDMPDLQRVYIMDIGGPHTMRTIYMNRQHPANLLPSYYGDSIGRWEGDTLVVDSIGFNERFWLDRNGLPHTDKLHLIERFTRTDFNTIKYEATIDDPGAYTGTVTSGFFLRWTPNE
jgi:hypothetical protein